MTSDGHDNRKSQYGVINEEEEYADLNEHGKQAYREYKNRQYRFHGTIITLGSVATIFGLTTGPIWLIFGAALTMASLITFVNPGPDTGALAHARLAERDPPERLSWEEHVKKYGNKDGEPLTDEEEQALITGEVDDPEWRVEHLDD